MIMYTAGHLGAAASLIDLSYLGGSAGTATSSTYTATGVSLGVAHANRRIIVPIGFHAAASGRTATVSVGGVSATQVLFTSTNSGSNYLYAGLYRANVPTGTTGDVVATTSANVLGMSILRYRMVNSTATVTDTATDTGTDPSVLLDIAADGGAVAYVVHDGDTGSTNWTNLTEDVDSYYDFADDRKVSSASDVFAVLQTNLAISTTITGDTMAVMVAASWPA